MGHSNSSLTVEAETATWPFGDPQATERTGKKVLFSFFFCLLSGVTEHDSWGESGLLPQHEGKEEYVWNARNPPDAS